MLFIIFLITYIFNIPRLFSNELVANKDLVRFGIFDFDVPIFDLSLFFVQFFYSAFTFRLHFFYYRDKMNQ